MHDNVSAVLRAPTSADRVMTQHDESRSRLAAAIQRVAQCDLMPSSESGSL